LTTTSDGGLLASVLGIDLTKAESPEFARLRAAIQSQRSAGVVLMACVETPSGANDLALLDALARHAGGSPLGSDWSATDVEMAEKLLSRVLARELAYDERVMSDDDAARFSRGFLDFFGEEGRPFTNSSVVASGNADVEATWTGSWAPLTRATFDTGIAIVGLRWSGLLWVGDGD
jgi:hypothetical protein